jgi:exopolysaccharide production protein ExoZ
VQPPGRIGYLQNLQVLRFLAAAMVVLSHLEHETGDSRLAGVAAVHDPSHISWAGGVDVFFMVSGFIMYHLTADRFGSRAYVGEFLKRRFIRVAPLYWIFTALMLVAIQTAHGEIHHPDAGWRRVLLSCLFLPTQRSDGLFMPILGAGWTLNLEIMFYLAYGAALSLRKPVGIAALVLAFFCLAVFSGPLMALQPALGVWAQPVILEFLAGILVAHLYRNPSLRVGRLVQLAGVALAFALMPPLDHLTWVGPWPMPVGTQPPDWSRWLWGGAPALLITASLMLGPQVGGLAGRVMARIGDASYALYLCHPFVLNVLALAWTRLSLPKSGWLYIACGMLACIAAALAVHRTVEVPLLALLRRRFEPTRAAVPA